MRRQQRYNLYDASGFFANGATMQAAPPHTVSRGPVVREGVRDSLGAHQFAISCAPCHGAGGFGGGPIAPNLEEKRPPSLRAVAAALPDTQLIAVMTNGVGVMPPLGWQLTPAARVAVAAYVKTLGARPPTDATRTDSATAAYLRRMDSLSASGATVAEIVRARRGS